MGRQSPQRRGFSGHRTARRQVGMVKFPASIQRITEDIMHTHIPRIRWTRFLAVGSSDCETIVEASHAGLTARIIMSEDKGGDGGLTSFIVCSALTDAAGKVLSLRQSRWFGAASGLLAAEDEITKNRNRLGRWMRREASRQRSEEGFGFSVACKPAGMNAVAGVRS